MRLSIAAIAAGCATAHAFTNTSPFLLFSTSKFSHTLPDELHSSKTVLSTANEILSSCPTERYLLVTHPNLNVQHLASSTAAPHLQSALASAKIQSRISVSEMAGPIDPHALSAGIKASCKAAGKTSASVETLDLDPIVAGEGRFQDLVDGLRESDADLGVVLRQYEAAGDYTVVYTAGPRKPEGKDYEAQFTDSAHLELKRQLGGGIHRRANETDRRSLFEKYQFFTPGIFMGLVALVVLFSILGVGVSALGSLQVPYGAFDKEMGPASQKKQQ